MKYKEAKVKSSLLRSFLFSCALATSINSVSAQWEGTGLLSSKVSAMAVNGTFIYVGTIDSGVLVSSDTGRSWTSRSAGLPNNPIYDTYTGINAMATSGQRIFAGLSGAGVFVTADSGRSWSAMNNGLVNKDVWSLATCSTFVFAGTNGLIGAGIGVFKSSITESSWTTSSSGIAALSSISCLTTCNGVLYAGANPQSNNGGVYLSRNLGNTWSCIGLTTANSIDGIAVKDSCIFVGITNAGVFMSKDAGANWAKVNTGLMTTSISDLLVVDNAVIAGTSGGGVYLTSNNGLNWSAANDGLVNTCCAYPLAVGSLAVCGSNLFASTGGGIWRRPLSQFDMTTHAVQTREEPVEEISIRVIPSSGISLTLRHSTQVAVNIYNMLGCKILSLVENQFTAGNHTITFRNLCPGFYTLRTTVGSRTFVNGMVQK